MTTNLLLNVQERGCEVQGHFALLPTAVKRFSFDFSVPTGWTVSEVTGPDNSRLSIERYASASLPSPSGKGAQQLPSPSGRGAGGEGKAPSNNATTLPATPHPGPLPEGEGDKKNPLPEGKGVKNAPHPGPLPEGEGDHRGRVHVKLPQGIAPGHVYLVAFRAQYTPPGWLGGWQSQSLEFPMFRVDGAERDEGNVAVAAEEDLEVRPKEIERLVPVTQAEMARLGMPAGATNLAYRYEGPGGKATIAVERTKSRATARTFAFFQIAAGALKAHYVVIYRIEDAKTRRLALLLPDSTPDKLAIRGLEGTNVKEFTSERAGTMRRWNVTLDAARRDEARLEVQFEMRLHTPAEVEEALRAVLESREPAAVKPDPTGKVTELKDFALPLLTAADVVYQSGMVAIEGDPELGVDVKTNARRADLGQLAVAKYTPASLDPNRQRPEGAKQPPMRLLGVYDFVGDVPQVTVDAARNPSYALTPAIVQRATLATVLSADGTSQTQATFLLRAKTPYVEVELPEEASLWSVLLDDVPLKPQKRNGVRLVGLPPAAGDAVRKLQLVYEAPVRNVTRGGRVDLAAPRLVYRADRAAKQSTEIPLVNIEWTVTVPAGYEAVATDGTLEAKPIERQTRAPLAVATALYELGGGVNGPGPGFLLAARESKRRATAENNLREMGRAMAPAAPEPPEKTLSKALGSWGVDQGERSWAVVDHDNSKPEPPERR